MCLSAYRQAMACFAILPLVFDHLREQTGSIVITSNIANDGAEEQVYSPGYGGGFRG